MGAKFQVKVATLTSIGMDDAQCLRQQTLEDHLALSSGKVATIVGHCSGDGVQHT